MGFTQFPTLRDPRQPLLTRVQDIITQTIIPVVQAVTNTPIMGAKPPPWIMPDLLNGWSLLYSGLQLKGNGYAKDALGYVWVSLGVVNNSGGAISAGTPIFSFPVGYRPVSPLSFAVSAHTNCEPVDVSILGPVSMANNFSSGSHAHLCFSFLAEA